MCSHQVSLLPVYSFHFQPPGTGRCHPQQTWASTSALESTPGAVGPQVVWWQIQTMLELWFSCSCLVSLWLFYICTVTLQHPMGLWLDFLCIWAVFLTAKWSYNYAVVSWRMRPLQEAVAWINVEILTSAWLKEQMFNKCVFHLLVYKCLSNCCKVLWKPPLTY